MKWIRPSGTECETNDRDVTIKYCESLGWKRSNEELNNDGRSEEMPVKKEAKKLGRPKKESN